MSHAKHPSPGRRQRHPPPARPVIFETHASRVPTYIHHNSNIFVFSNFTGSINLFTCIFAMRENLKPSLFEQYHGR
jgi:hypothetical protein